MNLPIITAHDLGGILDTRGVDDALKTVLDTISVMSKIEGFGELEELDLIYQEKEVTSYFLTKAQVLIISSRLRRQDRMKLVKHMDVLEEGTDLIRKTIKGDMKELSQEYKKKRDHVLLFRPLCNLLVPSLDNEFYAATHYQFTMLFNKQHGTNHTPYEIKEMMVKKKILKPRSMLPRKRPNYVINYLEFEHGNFKTLTLAYTISDINFLLSYL